MTTAPASPSDTPFNNKLQTSPKALLSALPPIAPRIAIHATELYVAMSEYTENWREETDDPYGSWSADTTVSINSVHVQPKGTQMSTPKGSNTLETCLLWYPSDQPLVDRMPIYLVYGRYSDGDSFGHHNGRIHLVAAFTDSTLAHTCEQRMQMTVDVHGARIHTSAMGQSTGYYPIGPTHLASDYVPWTGYFESLDSLYVEEHLLDLHVEPPVTVSSRRKLKK